MPLWVDGLRRTSAAQETPPLAALCMILMMLVPALTAFGLTTHRRGAREAVRVLGLVRAKPWRHELRCVAAALTVPLGLTAAGLAVSTLAGWYEPAHLPGPGTVAPLVLSALVSVPLYFGEELGWQGYMLPRLVRRGLLLAGPLSIATWPASALAVVGVWLAYRRRGGLGVMAGGGGEGGSGVSKRFSP